jgi:hypothetical protein
VFAEVVRALVPQNSADATVLGTAHNNALAITRDHLVCMNMRVSSNRSCVVSEQQKTPRLRGDYPSGGDGVQKKNAKLLALGHSQPSAHVFLDSHAAAAVRPPVSPPQPAGARRLSNFLHF